MRHRLWRLRRGRWTRRRPQVTTYRGLDGSVLQCCIAYNRHGAYCVPLSSRHRPAAQAILAGRVWEPDTIALVRDRAAAGNVVHAGTYFGDFLPALSAACGSGHKVYAFEPNPENFRCAQVTNLLNGSSNVELTHAALGSRNGRLPFRVVDERGAALGGESRVIDEADSDQDCVMVEIVALDDVLPVEDTIAVMQFDVEGSEQSALQGALKTILRCRPVLVLENLPGDAWLAENVFSLGYRPVGHVHENTVLEVQ